MNPRIGLFLLALVPAGPNLAATLTVTTTANAGSGSLRQALLNANLDPSLDSIVFALPGPGPHTISVLSELPAISSAVSIDGYTQAGASSHPGGSGSQAVWMVELSGAVALPGSDGLVINGGRLSLRGLAINGFRRNGAGLDSPGGDGIDLRSGALSVNGCLIGLRPDGSSAGNQNYGVRVAAGSGSVRIGSGVAADRNVLGANGGGVYAGRDGMVIENNLIGARPSGLNAGHLDAGVLIDADAVQIVANVIGGSSDPQTGYGIRLSAEADSARVAGNWIGLDAAGSNPRGNAAGGILIEAGESSADDHQIGSPDAPNVIAFNGGPGILVENGADRNALAFNRIWANERIAGRTLAGSSDLGIDLLPSFGVTGNDAGDGDDGANALQNHPLISNAVRDSLSGSVRISGLLNSQPGRRYRIAFYANRNADPSEHGEGEFLAESSLDVQTDANGNAPFVAQDLRFASGNAVLTSVTATATRILDDGRLAETSEFGPNAVLTSVGPRVLTVSTSADSNDGSCNAHCSLREAITAANADVNPTTPDVIVFAIPGTGPHTIALGSPLPVLSDVVRIDGYTQPGAAPSSAPAGSDSNAAIRIVIDGVAIADQPIFNLATSARDSLIRGLALVRAQHSAIRCAAACRVLGTWIGLLPDRSPAAAAGNGIEAGAFSQIGTQDAADQNVLVGNGGTGILAAQGAQIVGNVLGSDAQGGALGSFSDGVRVIGSDAVVKFNRILGAIRGLQLLDSAARADVQANGIIQCGLGMLVNGRAHRVRINTILQIDAAGIDLPFAAAQQNLLIGNIVYATGGLPVDLDASGVSANDPLDADAGANGLQNFPVLDVAQRGPDGVSVTGRLHAAPQSAYVISFCGIRAPALHPSGHGPCTDVPLAGGDVVQISVVTDAAGNAQFSTSLPLALPAEVTHVSAQAHRVEAGIAVESSELAQTLVITQDDQLLRDGFEIGGAP